MRVRDVLLCHSNPSRLEGFSLPFPFSFLASLREKSFFFPLSQALALLCEYGGVAAGRGDRQRVAGSQSVPIGCRLRLRFRQLLRGHAVSSDPCRQGLEKVSQGADDPPWTHRRDLQSQHRPVRRHPLSEKEAPEPCVQVHPGGGPPRQGGLHHEGVLRLPFRHGMHLRHRCRA